MELLIETNRRRTEFVEVPTESNDSNEESYLNTNALNSRLSDDAPKKPEEEVDTTQQ